MLRGLMALALLRFCEEFINQLNERSRHDVLAMFRREVDMVEERGANIQKQLTAYRVQERMLDPVSAAMGPLKLLATLSMQLAAARAQLTEVLKNAPKSPQIPLINTRIAALENLIVDERATILGEANSVATGLTEYERLTVQRIFTEMHLASVFKSREAARLDAERQQLYLETIARPALADYPIYPWRTVSFMIATACCLVAYGIVWLLVPRIRGYTPA